MQEKEKGSPAEPYGSFDSPETAKMATGGRVYECRGYEGHAIIVEDRNGRNWLYVKPESGRYRDVANEVWGGRMSADGKDADHVASRGMEKGYVLVGAVERGANRSHGAYEKPGRHLDRPFNEAAQRTDPDRLAKTLSHRQSHKVAGRMKGEMEGEPGRVLRSQPRPSAGDPVFDEATFGKPEHQARLEALKGREIGGEVREWKPPSVAQSYDGPRFWEPSPAKPDAPAPKKLK